MVQVLDRLSKQELARLEVTQEKKEK